MHIQEDTNATEDHKLVVLKIIGTFLSEMADNGVVIRHIIVNDSHAGGLSEFTFISPPGIFMGPPEDKPKYYQDDPACVINGSIRIRQAVNQIINKRLEDIPDPTIFTRAYMSRLLKKNKE